MGAKRRRLIGKKSKKLFFFAKTGVFDNSSTVEVRKESRTDIHVPSFVNLHYRTLTPF